MRTQLPSCSSCSIENTLPAMQALTVPEIAVNRSSCPSRKSSISLLITGAVHFANAPVST